MGTFKEYYLKNWEFNGQSAKCIYGIHTHNFQELAYPYDPDDLTRCFQCLRFICKNENIEDWKEIIKEVVDYYPNSINWRVIYDNFEELHNTYFAEYDSKSMQKTYNFMRGIFGIKPIEFKPPTKLVKKKEDHCRIDLKTNEMFCTNCGHRTAMPQNELLEYTTGCLKAFRQAHKNCKKKEE